MQHGFQRASLAPSRFAVDAVQVLADRVQILLRSRRSRGVCPACGGRSRRVQSRYRRRPADLPLGGRRVREGACSADIVLNILARQREPRSPFTILNTPQAIPPVTHQERERASRFLRWMIGRRLHIA